MKTAWKQLCKTADQEADLKDALVDGKRALSFLAELLEKRLDSSYKDQRRDNYEVTHWHLKQADFIGQQRTYKEILDLIKSTNLGE